MRRGAPVRLLDCSRPTARLRTPVVAVVGSGPAGLYTADELLRLPAPPRRIDVLERAPVHYGLLRHGVAPDHPEVKLVAHKFQNEVLDDVRVRLVGRVHVGGPQGPSLAELRRAYDAVFLCHGAELPRPLPVPAVAAASGELRHASPAPFGGAIPGYYSSREFVGWYNGDLAYTPLKMGLKHVRHVVVVGVGNVALDIGRLLLKDTKLLESTDVTRTALAELVESGVESVTLVGRREAHHAAFTTKELRELSLLPHLNVSVEPAMGPVDQELERAVRRRMQLLSDMSQREHESGAKLLKFRFLGSPKQLELDADGKVSGVRLVDGECLPAQLVVSSIGYRMDPMLCGEETLKNKRGRLEKGLYTTGWAKRGPTGILPSNKWDAAETVESYAQDNIEAGPRDGLPMFPKGHLTLEQMERIEQAERQRGQGKFVTWEEMEPHTRKKQ